MGTFEAPLLMYTLCWLVEVIPIQDFKGAYIVTVWITVHLWYDWDQLIHCNEQVKTDRVSWSDCVRNLYNIGPLFMNSESQSIKWIDFSTSQFPFWNIAVRCLRSHFTNQFHTKIRKRCEFDTDMRVQSLTCFGQVCLAIFAFFCLFCFEKSFQFSSDKFSRICERVVNTTSSSLFPCQTKVPWCLGDYSYTL